MNTRRLANLLAFFAVGLVAGLCLVQFLGQRFFGFGTELLSFLKTASFCIATLSAMFCAFAFAKSRRNKIFVWLFVLFVATIVVFEFVL